MTGQSTANSARALAEIENDLRNAEAAYLEADARLRQAELDRSDALKLLNAHQSEFDESVVALRARSVPVSTWGNEKNNSAEVLDLKVDQINEEVVNLPQRGVGAAAAEFDRLRASLKSNENALVKVRVS